MASDDDLALAAPNLEVKGAAGSCALSGLLLVLTGVQILGVRWIDEWMNYGRFVFIALGVVLFVLALRIYRGDTARTSSRSASQGSPPQSVQVGSS